jgi:plasmid stabilization system protein ParE
MNVRWSEQALAEFTDIAAYVANDFGKQAAIKMRDSVNDAILTIIQFPQIGKVCFTDGEISVEFRELVVKLSSVIYVIHEEEIYIVSIWNNRQDRKKLYAELKGQFI